MLVGFLLSEPTVSPAIQKANCQKDFPFDRLSGQSGSPCHKNARSTFFQRAHLYNPETLLSKAVLLKTAKKVFKNLRG